MRTWTLWVLAGSLALPLIMPARAGDTESLDQKVERLQKSVDRLQKDINVMHGELRQARETLKLMVKDLHEIKRDSSNADRRLQTLLEDKKK